MPPVQGTWGSTHNVSQTVDQYRRANQGKRPTAEFEKTAGGISIKTGANVTRARTFGISFRRAWPKIKTFVQSVTFLRFAGVGATRRRNTDVRHAGYNFDKGINTLVEDVAKGKVKTTEDFAGRLETLHGDAKVLMQKGRKTPADVQKRFQENLTESLAAAMNADPKAGNRVLNFFGHQSSGAFKNFYDAEITDPDLRQIAKNVGADKMSEENLFARSLLPGIRKSVAFQGNSGAIKGFNGNSLQTQAFGGSPEKAEAFRHSPSDFQAFGGNADAFEYFGENYKLFRAFGNDPNVLKGQNGAEVLSNWLDDTYGPGTGDKFLEAEPRYRNGINNEHDLSRLGTDVSKYFDPYLGKDYDYSDMTTDKIIARDNEAFAQEFDEFAAKNFGKENLDWLRDLADVRGKVDTQDVETSRAAVKNLVNRVLPKGGNSNPKEYKNNFDSLSKNDEPANMNVSYSARQKIVRAICNARGEKFVRGKERLADSIKFIDNMSKEQLKTVLKGFGSPTVNDSAYTGTASNVGDVLLRFTSGHDKSFTQQADLDIYKQHAEVICGPMFGPGVGTRVIDDYIANDKNGVLSLDEGDWNEIDRRLYDPPQKLLQPDENPLIE